eukprot:Clim_evm43s172 gene=Clim_evmTU43s172
MLCSIGKRGGRRVMSLLNTTALRAPLASTIVAELHSSSVNHEGFFKGAKVGTAGQLLVLSPRELDKIVSLAGGNFVPGPLTQDHEYMIIGSDVDSNTLDRARDQKTKLLEEEQLLDKLEEMD